MSWLSNFIKNNLCKKKELIHNEYGKYYYPVYNNYAKMFPTDLNIYNEFGEKLQQYYIRDAQLAHNPNIRSRYYILDRYNFGLDTHFYSHENMLEQIGKPARKYGMFIESQSILPESYKILDNNFGLHKDFKYIFTYSEDILNKYDNARFVPFCAAPFNTSFTQNIFGVWDAVDDNYKFKTKDISILSSDKLMCDLHKYRYDLAHYLKNNHLADTYGTFDGGSFVTLPSTLVDYRFTFAIENDITPYFFTERITSAFVTQTIPIYIGASRISDYFNADGIIQISTKDNIDDIIKMCTKEYYEERIPAILDNYNRVKEYFNPFDYLYEKYMVNDKPHNL